MTPLVLLGCALGLTALPVAAYAWGRRLVPRRWAHLVILSIASGAVLVEAALLLCAAPNVAAVFGLDTTGVIGTTHLFPGGTVAGWFSTVLAAGGLVSAAVAGTRSTRLHRTVRRTALAAPGHRSETYPDVYVLDHADPTAFAVSGAGGAIFVSAALLDGLGPEEAAAVIRHERAHLRHHHDRYLVVASALRGCLGRLPWIPASLSVLDLALERWADEDAAAHPGTREAVRAAILRLTAPTAAEGLAGFTTVERVAERVKALDRPAPVPAPLPLAVLYFAVLVLVIPDLASMVAWAG